MAQAAQRDTGKLAHQPRGLRQFSQRPLAVLLALALLAGLFVSSPPAPTEAQSTHVSFLPWVSNGEYIGGQGPWIGLFTFHNADDFSCFVQIYVSRNESWTSTAQFALVGHGMRTFSAESLRFPTPGTPVKFESTCELNVSVKHYAAPGRVTEWSNGAQVVTGYTGLSAADLAAARATPQSELFLPIVQTNSDWNTFITVANLGALTSAQVQVQIFPTANPDGRAGAALTLNHEIPVSGVWTIDTLAALNDPNFVGFARISSLADIGVIARRVKPTTHMAVTNVAIAADTGTSTGTYHTAAPLLFNAYNGWNTGISMANVSSRQAAVTVQYFRSGEPMLWEQRLVIQPYSMRYIYTPGSVDQQGFVGSANIISDQPLAVAVDEVKYETLEALSYMGSGVAHQQATITMAFREDPNQPQHDNSGISLVNMDRSNDQTVLLELRGRIGQLLAPPMEVILPANGSETVYLPFISEIPPGTFGTITLLTSNPIGFTAVSNDINYSVIGDGSVVFMATGSGGIYRVPSGAP